MFINQSVKIWVKKIKKLKLKIKSLLRYPYICFFFSRRHLTNQLWCYFINIELFSTNYHGFFIIVTVFWFISNPCSFYCRSFNFFLKMIQESYSDNQI